jgi:hypothetical protein
MAREPIRIEVLAGPVDREIPHLGERRMLDIKIRNDADRALLLSFTVTGEQLLRLVGGASLMFSAQRDVVEAPAPGSHDEGYLAGLKAAREYFGWADTETDEHHGAECDRAHSKGTNRCTCDEAATIADLLR